MTKTQSDKILRSGTFHAICLSSARNTPTALQIRAMGGNAWWVCHSSWNVTYVTLVHTKLLEKVSFFHSYKVGYKLLAEPNFMHLACFISLQICKCLPIAKCINCQKTSAKNILKDASYFSHTTSTWEFLIYWVFNLWLH